MARRGGRRGRRSRSKQRSKGAGSRSSKAKSSKSRSRNTRGSGARKSAPSKRRNTRTTSRASNRRAAASKARRSAPKRSAPKRSAPKKKAPTRRTPTKNRRGSGISSKRKNIGTKIGTTVKNTVKKVASNVKKTVGRVTRPPSAKAKTLTPRSAFNKQLKQVQAINKTSPKKTVAPKSREQKMRDAARKRNENFKKTRVQTFGGTRKNYSAAEARRIEKAGLNFSKVTGGAKNPIARPPANPNVKPGELMPQVQSFSDSLGLTDLSKNAAPTVNYNFSQRNTSLPSMGQLAKTDLSRFSKAVGSDKRISGGLGSRSAFSARPDSNLNTRDLFQAKDLGNMTTNAINTMVDKIPIIGEKLPNIMPMSMTDRDRQKYLGYNPNKPSSYLKQQARKMGGSSGGVSRIQQQVAAQQMQPEISQAPIPADEYLPEDAGDLTRIQTQAYNTALTNNMAGLAGDFDFGPQSSQMSISEAPGLRAGQSRGRRRIRRFGRGRRRGAGDSFRRGGRRIQEFTSTQLNI